MLEFKETINLFADMVTILAFILAIKAFSNWKKEQKHAKKLDYILDLEDRFLILLRNIQIEFKWFSDMDRNLIDIDNQTKEYQKQLYDFLKEEYVIYQKNDLLNKSFDEYSLSLLRTKRFIKDIDKECEILDFYYLKELSLEAIKLTPKWNNKDIFSTESEEFLKKIIKIQEEGIMYLQKEYE